MTDHTKLLAKWNALDKARIEAQAEYDDYSGKYLPTMEGCAEWSKRWSDKERTHTALHDEAPAMLTALNEMAAEVEQVAYDNNSLRNVVRVWRDAAAERAADNTDKDTEITRLREALTQVYACSSDCESSKGKTHDAWIAARCKEIATEALKEPIA